jgi:hypothetical protein
MRPCPITLVYHTDAIDRYSTRFFAPQICSVAVGREAAADQHGVAGAGEPHLPQPQVLEQADQVPHRRHRPEGDPTGGGGHAPCRRGG